MGNDPGFACYHREEANGRKAGDVVRVHDGAFGDAVILGFNEQGYAKLARPYVYANSVGTTGPNALTGVEYMEFISPTCLALYLVIEDDGHRRK